MKQQTVSVTEFKAKCLALLDDIGEHGGTITVTKRGRPLATVGPAKKARWKSPEGIWSEHAAALEPLMDPNTTMDWECVSGSSGDKD